MPADIHTMHYSSYSSVSFQLCTNAICGKPTYNRQALPLLLFSALWGQSVIPNHLWSKPGIPAWHSNEATMVETLIVSLLHTQADQGREDGLRKSETEKNKRKRNRCGGRKRATQRLVLQLIFSSCWPTNKHPLLCRHLSMCVWSYAIPRSSRVALGLSQSGSTQ